MKDYKRCLRISEFLLSALLCLLFQGVSVAEPKVTMHGKSNSKAYEITNDSDDIVGRIATKVIKFDGTEFTDPDAHDALVIQPSLSDNYLYLGGSKGYGNGVVIDPLGQVGIGNFFDTDPSSVFQIGTVEPFTVFAGGAGTWWLFNTYYDGPSGHFKYISNSGSRSEASAGLIGIDEANDFFQINVAPPDSSGETMSDINAIRIEAGTTNAGKVGIGLKYFDPAIYPYTSNQATEALDVNGKIAFRNYDENPDDSDGNPSTLNSPPGGRPVGWIWADHVGLKAHDNGGNVTAFSPHEDPRALDSTAITSFADPSVVLPYSFQHENEFIGKGQIIDMSKIIKYVETKMKAELGSKEGQAVFNYDLPSEKVITQEQFELKTVMEDLAAMPRVEVNIHGNGAIPADAIEQVEETKTVSKIIQVEEKELDLELGRIVSVKKDRKIFEEVKTGRQVKRLKSGWKFTEGKLYRPSTVDDLNLDAIVKRYPQLPAWVLQRVKSSSKSGLPVSALVQEVKARLAEAKPAQPREDYDTANSILPTAETVK